MPILPTSEASTRRIPSIVSSFARATSIASIASWSICSPWRTSWRRAPSSEASSSEDGLVVRAGAEEHHLAREGGLWILRAKRGDKAIDAWVTTLERDYPIDFELGNHYTSTHPSSSFRSRLMMRVLTRDGRITVSNRDVTTTRDGVAETRRLPDRAALRTLLAESFGFDLPEVLALKVPSEPEWG